jgi:tryptophan-rich sensory protein
MNRNLRIYEHEAERSHAHEAVVASAWTVLLVVMAAASLLHWQSKPIETAHVAAPAGLSSR